MDHGHMDHGHMDHGDMGHGGHGDMDMGGGPKCNMNMLFTWDTTDLCIVFRSWHVGSTWSLIVSLLGVVVLCAGYELVREVSRRYEASVAARQSGVRVGGSGVPANNAGGRTVVAWSAREEKRVKIVKAVLYAVQVFYSFFIMLLFMTYNGWVMLAVAVGAFVGYLAFGNAGGAGGSATKSVACH
ncbi:Copper transport protein CTR2 [Lasiodiplodia hormozganensis]|uniref:Copper transport protein n=1 Tax=Lasiodiplodia hormozganensis TaxID=869390 RepID=A0AA39YYW8_9PEZI|nr:Copper transport protein CTR2 [Lasiodiplodia hormozganensis]